MGVVLATNYFMHCEIVKFLIVVICTVINYNKLEKYIEFFQ